MAILGFPSVAYKNLGKIDSMTVRIFPGDYQIIGRRKDYKDVKMLLQVRNGTTPPTVTVACTGLLPRLIPHDFPSATILDRPYVHRCSSCGEFDSCSVGSRDRSDAAKQQPRRRRREVRVALAKGPLPDPLLLDGSPLPAEKALRAGHVG